MGNGHSKRSSGLPDILEAHQVETADQGERSDETDKAQSDDGGASQSVPQREEVGSFSLPPAEPGPEEVRENSEEVGQPPFLSQSASSDKPGELDVAKTPVADSSEKAEHPAPQIPLEAAGEPVAEPEVLTSEDPTTDPEVQTTAEGCLAESPAQKKPNEINSCSDGNYEVIIIKVHSKWAASEMVEGCFDPITALVTERLDTQNSAEAERTTAKSAEADSTRVERAPRPTAETRVEQNKGRSAVDAQTTKGGNGQTAAEIPAETDGETPAAQRTLEGPLASDVDRYADIKFIDDDGDYLTTESMSSGKDHPATASTIPDPEVNPLPDHLAEPSSKTWQDLGEAKQLSPGKEMGGACSTAEAIEMAETQAGKLGERPQTERVSCTKVTLEPVALETQPVATAAVHAQLQGASGTQKDSTEGPGHTRKFSKTFYFCCSQCSGGDGEPNGE